MENNSLMRNDTITTSEGVYQSVIYALKGNSVKTKDITKSFRLDEDIIKKISEQAKITTN
jgi:hypothetical protein